MTESEQETKDLSPEVIENHKQLIERDNQNKARGYDYEEGVKFVLEQSLPLGELVLEIGTGKGRFMTAVASHVKELITLDVSAQEQQYARLNAAYAGVGEKISYVVQDAATLPWPNKTFDAVITMNAIHHIPHFEQVLKEMQRVVKTTGKIILADFSPRGFQIMGKIHRSEGRVHQRHFHELRNFQRLLRNQGWTTRLRKGYLQEVLVAWKKKEADSTPSA
ncbi:MAG: class I SAM-dependent methyltransferase [Limisphaerales bacterium]|jgi:ubiquinone/menaquinone biosynthesis C-methylase UbiE|nr:class I SAM-dependent methyltransferase [Verrucomicrobiota bacterium]